MCATYGPGFGLQGRSSFTGLKRKEFSDEDNTDLDVDGIGLSPHGRFKKANELLFSAHNDLSNAEDVPQALGLRNRSRMHIDRAHQIVDAAERTAHWE